MLVLQLVLMTLYMQFIITIEQDIYNPSYTTNVVLFGFVVPHPLSQLGVHGCLCKLIHWESENKVNSSIT